VTSEAPLATPLILESYGVCAASPLLPFLLLLLLLEMILETDDTDDEWEEELTLSIDYRFRGLMGGLAVPPEASDKFAELLKSYPIEPSKDEEDVVELPEEEKEEKGHVMFQTSFSRVRSLHDWTKRDN
jgi:hypothetical protein